MRVNLHVFFIIKVGYLRAKVATVYLKIAWQNMMKLSRKPTSSGTILMTSLSPAVMKWEFVKIKMETIMIWFHLVIPGKLHTCLPILGKDRETLEIITLFFVWSERVRTKSSPTWASQFVRILVKFQNVCLCIFIYIIASLS